jgi:DamX protein
MITPSQPEMTNFETELTNQVHSNRFFPAGGRGELLDQVLHLTRYGSLVVNVTGEAGLGKTHLMQAVKASLPHTAIEVHAALLMSSTELLNQILHQLMANRFHHDLPDLPSSTDEQTLLSLIFSYLTRLAESGSSIVLLIDDAHELSEDALLVLLRILLDKKHQATLRCVLFSEPTLCELLTKPSLKEAGGDEVFTLMMPVMDQEAVKEYLSFLESTKPESERILFSESDAQSIFELSEGKLSQIHAAIRSLLDKDTKVAVPSSAYPRSYIAALSVVVVSVIAIALLYQWQLPTEELDVAQIANQGALSDSTTKGQVLDSSRIVLLEEDTNSISIRSDDGSDEKKVSSSLLEQLRKKHKEIEAQNAPSKDAVTVNVDTIKPTEAVELKEKKPEVSVMVPASVDLDEEGAEASEKVVSERDRARDWVLGQSARHYTIQILGAHSEKNVSRYVDRYKGDKSDLVIYDAVLREKPWFVLIHGSYASRVEAKQVSERLGLKEVWIRSFASVQKEINNR